VAIVEKHRSKASPGIDWKRWRVSRKAGRLFDEDEHIDINEPHNPIFRDIISEHDALARLQV